VLPDTESFTAPGPLLRLTAAGAAIATGLVVASAAFALQSGHWAVTLVALPLLAAIAIAAHLTYPQLRREADAALALTLAAVATGGLVGLTDDAGWASALHVAAAGGALGAALLVLAASLERGVGIPKRHMAVSDLWRDYLALTKPRVMTLLLLTGAAGMFVAAGGAPALWLLVVTMLGLALACGGASALNHVMDADIDKLMGQRTASRPVAAGRVAPSRALEFALVISALSFTVLASAVNVLTAVLALVGNLFYVVVYTRYLKRSTPQNIVIGGAAGAVPPLVGYAAVTGNLALPALWLFVIVLLWTPPHFWALAIMIKEHYAAAEIPMLPNVRGDRETTRQIVWYAIAMVVFTVAVGVWLGPLYTVAAVVLGAAFLVLAWRLLRDTSRRRAAVLFHYSLAYLAVLFLAAAVDPIVI
jgi:protoheme IX farnesyltransferase